MSLQGVKTPGTPLYLAAERERIKWSWELYGRGNLGECLSPLQKRQFTAWWSPRLVLLLSQSISYWGLGHGCYAGSLALSWREAHVSCKVFPCMHLKCIHRWGRARWRRESPSCPRSAQGHLYDGLEIQSLSHDQGRILILNTKNIGKQKPSQNRSSLPPKLVYKLYHVEIQLGKNYNLTLNCSQAHGNSWNNTILGFINSYL